MKEHKVNFDKIIIIPKQGHTLMEAKHTTKFCSFHTINTGASSLRWGACTENGRTGGQLNLEVRELHINTLE